MPCLVFRAPPPAIAAVVSSVIFRASSMGGRGACLLEWRLPKESDEREFELLLLL